MRRHLLVFCGFSFLTLAKTWPLAANLGTHLTSPLDPLLLSSVLAWDAQAIASNPLQIFEAPFLYPLEHSLAFSDHLLGLLPLFGPVYALTHNPVLGYNFVLLASFALGAFAAYQLALRWTGAFGPSVLAGLLFGFAPLRWGGDLHHLQILAFFWTPAALLFLDRFWKSQSWLDLAVFSALCWLQVLSAFYLAWLMAIALGLYVLLHGKPPLLKGGLFLLASVLVLAPLHWPYIQVQKAWGAERQLDDVADNSPDALAFLVPEASMNDLHVRALQPAADRMLGTKRLFPGLLWPFLAGLGLLWGRRWLSSPEGRRLWLYSVVLTGTALILSLGPTLIVAGHKTNLTLPYGWLHGTLPGWSAMRAPARFVHLAGLGGCLLAALGAGALASRRGWRAEWVCLVCGLVFLVELGAKPLALTAAPTGSAASEVYQWLASHKPGPLLELPAGRMPEFRYTLAVSDHRQPLLNARTGFYPPAQAENLRQLEALPAPEAVRFAGALGLKAIVVHTRRLKPAQQAAWQMPDLPLLAEFGPDRVYGVPEVPVSSELQAIARVTDQRISLEIRTLPGLAWRHPKPQGRKLAHIRWNDQQSAAVVRLPLVLRPDESRSLPLRFTPDPPVRTLQITVPELNLATPVWQGGRSEK